MSMPAKGKWGVLMPLLPTEEGGWRGYAHDGNDERVLFYYDKEFGLMAAEELSHH
jgi:hypothetical protein